jgi:amino acid permease
VFQWAIVLPLELTVAGITVEYWQVGVNVGVWITGMFLQALQQLHHALFALSARTLTHAL